MLNLTKVLYLMMGACKSNIFLISKFNAGAHCSSLKWGVPFICGLPLKKKQQKYRIKKILNSPPLCDSYVPNPINNQTYKSGINPLASQMENRLKFHDSRDIN